MLGGIVRPPEDDDQMAQVCLKTKNGTIVAASMVLARVPARLEIVRIDREVPSWMTGDWRVVDVVFVRHTSMGPDALLIVEDADQS